MGGGNIRISKESIVDKLTNKWTEISTLPYNFYYGSAVVYNNEIHILGGISGGSTSTKQYKYNG